MEWLTSVLQLQDFLVFLKGWEQHAVFIIFAAGIWISIVFHLVATGHATFVKKGETDHIVCGDTRVWGLLVIFAGSAGLSFGLPYFWLMNFLHLSGYLAEYWSGFVYMQFATSVIQSVLLILYAALGPRKKWWRFVKAHLKGCGWVSALSPIGWILYLIQQFLPNKAKFIAWILRDIETVFTFAYNTFHAPMWIVCGTASIVGSLTHFNVNLFIPGIWWIDEDHVEDEDSSSEN